MRFLKARFSSVRKKTEEIVFLDWPSGKIQKRKYSFFLEIHLPIFVFILLIILIQMGSIKYNLIFMSIYLFNFKKKLVF